MRASPEEASGFYIEKRRRNTRGVITVVRNSHVEALMYVASEGATKEKSPDETSIHLRSEFHKLFVYFSH